MLLTFAVTSFESFGAASSFTATGSMTMPRAFHTATLLADGKVLVAGGTDEFTFLNTAELYDPARGTFTPTSTPMTSRREYHSATLLPNGRVLIAGGYDGSHSVSSAELYDPANGTFTATASMTVARHSHTATLLADGKVLIAGGYDASLHLLNTAELYDPEHGTFTATNGPMTSRRVVHTATLLPNGKVLIVGGLDGSTSFIPTAELYEPASGMFVATSSPTTGVRNTATRLQNGTVLIAGGFKPGNTADSAEVYDADRGTFAPANAHMRSAREDHTATLLANGQVLIVGGYEMGLGHFNYQPEAELYDPSPRTFVATTARLLADRYEHTATLLLNGNVLIVGGYTGASQGLPVNTAEIFAFAIAPATKRRAAAR